MLSGVCWGRVWDSAVEGCAAAHISCERWMFHVAEPRMQKTVMLQESRVIVSGDQRMQESEYLAKSHQDLWVCSGHQRCWPHHVM